MSNPFDSLKSKPKEEDLKYDEWGGQFGCSTPQCYGWANIAKFFPKQHILIWKCQHGHVSTMENVDE